MYVHSSGGLVEVADSGRGWMRVELAALGGRGE